MPEQLGRLLLIRIGDGATPTEAFTALCGVKTRSFNLSANEIDTTYPSCTNPGGPVQKTSRPGVLNRTFTGTGTFVSGAAQSVLMGYIRNGEIFNAEVVVPGDGEYVGPWMVSDFSLNGDMEDDLQFDGTWTAAGPLTFTAEV